MVLRVSELAAKTGISPHTVRDAVETVMDFVESKRPPPDAEKGRIERRLPELTAG